MQRFFFIQWALVYAKKQFIIPKAIFIDAHHISTHASIQTPNTYLTRSYRFQNELFASCALPREIASRFSTQYVHHSPRRTFGKLNSIQIHVNASLRRTTTYAS